MQLSPPIATYFEADQRHDGDAIVAAFADDAVVRDEGAEHAGPTAIRAWWQAAKARYRHHVLRSAFAPRWRNGAPYVQCDAGILFLELIWP